ncbi:hypothetical protein D5F01_LYC23707 [Larimichthys crocea]|uniref:Craniofacial development protein 2 n=1 Tax=Larimichthys crocea TaxID=215358 RepID=A0A6G0HGP4_LARCR|nr:hypothetical protein D5F01_LYC23707 [Larimichthys crocea]
MTFNVVSRYAPQVGCELEEKEKFWLDLDEVMQSIPRSERVVIGADFNGHVGAGNRDDEEVMGRFGIQERNAEGQMVVDFAKRIEMAVVDTFIQKRQEHRVTYKSGGRSTQVDYILCRRCNLKEISDCKVVVANVIKETGRSVLGVSSGRKVDKETWWWNEEVKECVRRKRLTKKKWDTERTEESRQEYREMQHKVRVEVAKAKQGAYDGRAEEVTVVDLEVAKISEDEVRRALKRMKSGKALGPDDIPVEVWKCLGEMAVHVLTGLFNRILDSEKMPRGMEEKCDGAHF